MKLHRTFRHLLIVLVLLIAILMIITTQKQRFKKSAEKTLSGLLNAGITFDHMKTNIFSDLTVCGIRIAYPQDSSRRILILIPDLRIGYHLADILGKKPLLRQVVIDSVFIQILSSDTTSFTTTISGNSSENNPENGDLPFPFRQLRIGYCKIESQDSLVAGLNRLRLDLEKDESNRIQPRLEIENGSVRKKDRSAYLFGFRIDGTIAKNTDSLRINGTLSWESLNAGSLFLGNGGMNVRWDGNTFELTAFHSDLCEGKILASGVYSSDASRPNRLDCALENVRFDQLWTCIGDSIAGSYGILNSRIRAEGTGLRDTSWTIDGEHDLTDLRYRRQKIADIKAVMRVRRGHASFKIDHPELHADALWTFGGDALKGHFSMAMQSLDPLRLFVDLKKLQGNVCCEGDLSGTRENPELSVDITDGGCRYDNMTLDTLRGRLMLQNQVLTVERLSAIHEPNPDIPVNFGRITAHGQVDVHDLTGQVDMQFVRPSIRGLTADSVFVAFDLSREDISVQPLRIYQNNRILFESRLTAGTPVTRLGLFTPVSGTMTLSRFKIGWLAPFMPEPWQAGGVVSGELAIQGTAGDPVPGGFLEIDDFRLDRGSAFGTLDSLQGRLSLDNRNMMIDSLQGLVDSIPFRLAGNLEMNDQSMISGAITLNAPNQSRAFFTGQGSRNAFQIESQIFKFDLSILKKYMPDFAALAGYSEGKLTILGPMANPGINGNLRFRELTIQPKILASPLKNGAGFCRFEEQHFYMDSLRFDSENGSFYADAALKMNAGRFQLEALHVKTDQLTFLKKNSYDFRIRSIRLSLSPQESQLLLSGEIDLGKTVIRQPFQIRDLISRSRRPPRSSPAKETYLDKIQCRIRLQTNDKFWIDNNLAKLRLSPEIEMTGALAKPNIKGRVTVREGYALYLDRKFQIKQGTLDFIDPYQINPVVDLSAEATIKDYETMDNTEYVITLSASGPLNQAQISLSSEPEMTQPDIITLLTLGTTRKQLTSQSGTSHDKEWIQIIRQRAESLSSQRINAYATQRIGTLFKLDHLSIDGNLFQNGKSLNPQISATRTLTPKIDVKYMSRVGQLNEQFIVVDYKLTRLFSLEGQTNQYGQSGMDLKYRIGFK